MAIRRSVSLQAGYVFLFGHYGSEQYFGLGLEWVGVGWGICGVAPVMLGLWLDWLGASVQFIFGKSLTLHNRFIMFVQLLVNAFCAVSIPAFRASAVCFA